MSSTNSFLSKKLFNNHPKQQQHEATGVKSRARSTNQKKQSIHYVNLLKTHYKSQCAFILEINTKSTSKCTACIFRIRKNWTMLLLVSIVRQAFTNNKLEASESFEAIDLKY